MKNISTAIKLSVALVCISCDGLEVKEEKYGSLGQAIAAGAVERGWLPMDLPKSAVNINEVHDLDVNDSVVHFTSDNNEADVFLKSCKMVNKSEVVFPRKKLLRAASRWEVKGNIQSAANTYYSCSTLMREVKTAREMERYLAVSENMRSLWFWSVKK